MAADRCQELDRLFREVYDDEKNREVLEISKQLRGEGLRPAEIRHLRQKQKRLDPTGNILNLMLMLDALDGIEEVEVEEVPTRPSMARRVGGALGNVAVGTVKATGRFAADIGYDWVKYYAKRAIILSLVASAVGGDPLTPIYLGGRVLGAVAGF